MRKKEMSLLLSRYLIEDNQEDYVIFNKSLSANNSVVLAIFRKLVGNYKLMEASEEEQLRSTVYNVWNKEF